MCMQSEMIRRRYYLKRGARTMFSDSEKTLDIVNDNLTKFMLAIVEFIEKVKKFFETYFKTEG